jgi:RNA polymerase sigma-70 factor (ECF subfamily)
VRLVSKSHSAAPLDDATIMRRVCDGDPAAFAALYDRHAAAAQALAHRMLRDRTAAEDVTQEAFVGLWRSRTAYVPARGAVRSWLLMITRNRAIDAIRRRGLPDELWSEWGYERESPERTDEEALRRSEADALGAALRQLPEGQRCVIDLAYFGGLSQTEIAAQLGLPLGTVKSRVRLALSKLAEQVESPSPVPAS